MTEKIWFVVIGTERKGPFSEEQMAGLLAAGTVTAHSSVWSRVSTNEAWTPLYRSDLKHLVGDGEIEPPPLPVASSATASATRPPVTLPGNMELTDWGQGTSAPVSHAQAAAIASPLAASPPTRFASTVLPSRMALAGTWLLGGMNVVFLRMQMRGPDDLESRFARYHATPDNIELISVLALLAIVVFAIGLFWWSYNSTLNLQTLDGPQTVTPAGSIYWYFVPIANIWKPYHAMRNLVDGFVVEKRDLVRLVCLAWWLLWIGSLVLEVVASQLLSKVKVARSDAELGLQLTVWSSIVGIAACATLYFLINSVQDGATRRTSHGTGIA